MVKTEQNCSHQEEVTERRENEHTPENKFMTGKARETKGRGATGNPGHKKVPAGEDGGHF